MNKGGNGGFFFFFCVPGHARSSVRCVRQSPQSAAVSQPVPKASRGHPSDWAMSGVSKRRRWGRTAGCGWWGGGGGKLRTCAASEWEIFSLWRWERSWRYPVLSLKIVT